MKSVLQAVWCFTVALGDLIIIIIAELDMFPNLVSYGCLFQGLTRALRPLKCLHTLRE